MWNSEMHLVIMAVVIAVLFAGRKINRRRPPTHPLPVTSPAETNGSAAPKEKPWRALIDILRFWRLPWFRAFFSLAKASSCSGSMTAGGPQR